jgi:hypothetical protein
VSALGIVQLLHLSLQRIGLDSSQIGKLNTTAQTKYTVLDKVQNTLMHVAGTLKHQNVIRLETKVERAVTHAWQSRSASSSTVN